jgi:hypothetical protein
MRGAPVVSFVLFPVREALLMRRFLVVARHTLCGGSVAAAFRHDQNHGRHRNRSHHRA